MTITDLSTMLGVPVDTLYGWRHRGEGPMGYRIGCLVRYRRSSVEAWLEQQADRRRSHGIAAWLTSNAVAFSRLTAGGVAD
jgi:excisionase family DNA binding protein